MDLRNRLMEDYVTYQVGHLFSVKWLQLMTKVWPEDLRKDFQLFYWIKQKPLVRTRLVFMKITVLENSELHFYIPISQRMQYLY